MRPIWGIAGMWTVGLASQAMGQTIQAFDRNVVEAKPIRAARIRADGRQIGPWVYLNETGSRKRDEGVLDVIFDTFENDRSKELWNSPPGADTYGPPTMAGSDRWFFGWGYAGNSIIGDQFKLNPVMRGRMAPFMQHAWAQSYTERLYLLVRTAETFGYGSLPALDGHLSGVVFDMGVLEEHTVYALSADLRGTGLDFQIGGDVDGNGAHQVTYASFYDGSNLIYSQGNQPMLWGTRGTNPSENHTYEWWDEDPGNGIFDLWECYEMWFGVEPDPLAMMIAFYGYRPSPELLLPAYYAVGPPGKEMGDHDVTKLLDADGIEVHGRNTITGSNEQPSLLMRIGFARDNADRVYQLATTVRSRSSIANIQQRVGYARWDNVSSVIYVDTHTFTTGQLDAARTATLNDPATLAQVIHPDSGWFKVVTAYRKIGLVPSLRYDVYVDQIVAEVQH